MTIQVVPAPERAGWWRSLVMAGGRCLYETLRPTQAAALAAAQAWMAQAG